MQIILVKMHLFLENVTCRNVFILLVERLCTLSIYRLQSSNIHNVYHHN